MEISLIKIWIFLTKKKIDQKDLKSKLGNYHRGKRKLWIMRTEKGGHIEFGSFFIQCSAIVEIGYGILSIRDQDKHEICVEKS